MIEDITDIITEFPSIKKEYNEYQIELIININSSLTIGIKNGVYYYESNFDENFIQQQFNSNINKIYNIINELIDKDEIKIEKNKDNLKLILNYNNSYKELNIEISFKYIFETLNELNNKIKIKDILIIIIIMMILIFVLNIFLFSLFINNNKKAINKIENNKVLNNKMTFLNEKINEIEKYNITDIKNKINEIEKYNITDIKNKINEIEKYNITDINNKITEIILAIENIFSSLSIQYIKTNLTNINIIPKSSDINSLSIFLSGNIISVLDKSLIIYEYIFNSKKTKNNDYINYIDIYDENNYVSFSDNQSIITWIKNNNNEYSINKITIEAHSERINKVIYYSKEKLISCSDDGLIKIWEFNNDSYTNITTFNHTDIVNSLLLLEDNNILISSGYGLIFWNLTTKKSFITFDNIETNSSNSLERIDENRFIICDSSSKLIIFSISNLKIIKTIEIDFFCDSVKSIQNKGIFLVGGMGYNNNNDNINNIYVYRSDNYELIQTIENAHNNRIMGFAEINYRLVISYSLDELKYWSF